VNQLVSEGISFDEMPYEKKNGSGGKLGSKTRTATSLFSTEQERTA
jgi:hypothetical protein